MSDRSFDEVRSDLYKATESFGIAAIAEHAFAMDALDTAEAEANALHEHKNSPPDPLSHASLERGSYNVVPRGSVDVKGKGAMQTYWLEIML